MGPVLLNIFIDGLNVRIKCNLCQFADDTKLRGSANVLEDRKGSGQAGRDVYYPQRDLDRMD